MKFLTVLTVGMLAAGCGSVAADSTASTYAAALDLGEELLAEEVCDESGCSDETLVKFTDGQFRLADASEEAALVVEPNIYPYYPVIGKRSRFLAAYRFHRGTLESWLAPVRVPKRMVQIARRFDTLEAHFDAGVRAFSEDFSETYDNYLTNYNSGHNANIVGAILLNNPKTPLVVLQLGNMADIFGQELFCHGSAGALLEKSLEHAKAVKQLLSKHKVRFINFSAGFIADGVKDSYAQECDRPLAPGRSQLVLTALTPLMHALAGSQDTLLVQAAAYQGRTGPFDCDSQGMESRLRVGAINLLDSDLTAAGVSSAFVSDGQKSVNLRQLKHYYHAKGVCADVYVNMNLDRWYRNNERAFKKFENGGLSTAPMSLLTSTSDAAPLALSWAIHIRSHLRDWHDGMIEDIGAQMVTKACDYLPNSRCVFRDPLKFDQVGLTNLGGAE